MPQDEQHVGAQSVMLIGGAALFAIALIGAFIVGFAANRGGTCAVMAARTAVRDRDVRLFIGFLVASAAGGLVAIPIAWLIGADDRLSGSVDVGFPLLCGGFLLGLGAVLNNGCLIGSLWRFGNGEVRLIALPIGLALGYRTTQLLPFRLLAAPHPSPFSLPSHGALILLSIEALLLGLGLSVLLSAERKRAGSVRSIAMPMLTFGMTGGLLFVIQPGWTYADLVRRQIARPTMDALATGAGWLLVVMTALGALASALRAGDFHLQPPTFRMIGQTLVGGALMAAGAALIPGGNDFLLLAAVPDGSSSGLAGLATITLTILIAELVIQYGLMPRTP